MDYKYIEQLLSRYWQCQTSLEEEQILRAFFSQDDIPEELLANKSLFTYSQQASQDTDTLSLGEDFDQRILSQIGEDVQQKTHVVNFRNAIMSLLKAVAVAAVVITIGNITERTGERVMVDTESVADTYILEENISAEIKIIDREKAEKLAQLTSDTLKIVVDEQKN